MKALTLAWIGTSNHAWSAAQRLAIGDSLRAVWNGSASRLVNTGTLVTLREALAKSPVICANANRHSRQRIASRSPPMLK
ncbi:hypothetical protein D3C80_1969710 [compost metagenome]